MPKNKITQVIVDRIKLTSYHVLSGQLSVEPDTRDRSDLQSDLQSPSSVSSSCLVVVSSMARSVLRMTMQAATLQGRQ